ncbi:MAG: T9SS type A sorting domain-containing protein [Bacteroidota bacterium]|nr:T9SS type A sorting domain-containing protein [Bacteroidota bacterium]
MKRALLIAIAALTVQTAVAQDFNPTYLSVIGSRTAKFNYITKDKTFYRDSVYMITGITTVKGNATLTIEAGTLIVGDTAANQRGVLIISREGKINAVGKVDDPIIFTSLKAKGKRQIGDWGGIIIFGKAPFNQAPGTKYEGGVLEDPSSPTDQQWGGSEANHNSGSLAYARIEFAGFPFAPNREVNSLTMGGVGNGTRIDHIQVSYGGDDSYEWFGGTNNLKYLIAYNGVDDDFDVDFGYSGKVQFGVAIRNPNIADASQSNGFEVDNDGTGTGATPFTSGVFSNITMVGPMQNSSTPINSLFGRAGHLRRNNSLRIFNSLFMGWRTGVQIDGTGAAAQANAPGGLIFANNITQSYPAAGKMNTYFDTIGVRGTLNPMTYFAANNNTKIDEVADAGLTDPFNASKPNVTPKSNSPLASGGLFTNNLLTDAFFTSVTYRGAVDPNRNWFNEKWVNFDPINTEYKEGKARTFVNITAIARPVTEVSIYPNPAANQTTFQFSTDVTKQLDVKVLDITGKVVANVANASFNGGSNQININTENLNNGMYFIQVNGAASGKFTVVK